MTTCAPAAASARAVSHPIPAVAPVTSAVLPDKSCPASTSFVVLSKPKFAMIFSKSRRAPTGTR
jgi:hypothetical protein